MSKLVYLCLGIILLAAQFGCGGGAASNANGTPAANNVNSANPGTPGNPVPPVNPNDPGTPANVNTPGVGPIAQENGKGGKPGLANANTIAPPPSDGGGLSFAAMDFHGALLRGNKEQMAVLVADDFKGTMLDGSVQNKTQMLAAAKDSGELFSANVNKPEVKGETGTVTGSITMMGADAKVAKAGQVVQFTDTWRKRGDKWLLTSTKITK